MRTKDLVWVLSLGLGLSCDGDKDSATCLSTLYGTFPAYGATAADLASPIRFTIARADPTATITTTIPGTQVVETQADGLTTDVLWVPDAPLSPDTDYRLELGWCDGVAALDFHTLALGAAPDTAQLATRSWAIFLQNGRVAQPAEAGDAVVEQLVLPAILLSVTSVEGTAIHLRAGLSTAMAATGPQNWCAATMEMVGDYSLAPYFIVTADEMALPVNDEVTTIRDVRITGTFADDGSRIDHLTLWGQIDVRQGSTSTGYTPDELCTSVMPQLGVYCEPCADSLKYCMTLGFDEITAPEAGSALDPVPGNNCESCSTQAPASDAVCE